MNMTRAYVATLILACAIVVFTFAEVIGAVPTPGSFLLGRTVLGSAGYTVLTNAPIYVNSSGKSAQVSVNASGSNKFLRQVSSGAPTFSSIADGDLPTALASHTISGGTINNTPIGGTTAADGKFTALETSGDVTHTTGNLIIATAGKGLQVKEGSNARMGQATFTNGKVTVANTSITANTRIFLTPVVASFSQVIYCPDQHAGIDFDIYGNLDSDSTTKVNWMLVEPAP